MTKLGSFKLCDRAITTPVTGEAQTAITGLVGARAVTIETRFDCDGGGGECRVWIQTALDKGGVTWMDVACFAFTTSSAVRLVNLSAMTPFSSQVTPTNGALADNTCVDGVLGISLRALVTVSGSAYSNTSLTVYATVR